MRRRKGILATTMLTLALAVGMKDDVRIKKAKQIHRSWKDDQDVNSKHDLWEKARLKRVRKAKLKERNLQRSRNGK